MTRPRPRVRPVSPGPAPGGLALRPVLALAGVVVALLVVTAHRYGPHRDELYAVAAGRHLAWGYPDQPPLTPLVARAMSRLAPGSLTVLRLPSALAVGALVLVTAATARELGGGRRAQVLAGACVAASTVVLVAGHLLSTTTFDLLSWATLTLLLVKALRRDAPVLWLAAGLVAGVGMLDKQLLAALGAAFVLAVLLVGPRDVLHRPWPWLGAALALLLAAPFLAWQAAAGWPALHVAASVAAGGSTSSQPRVLFLPFQLALVGPLLVPVWAAGLVHLWRDRRLRPLAAAYPLLATLFLVTGGKPYYLAGLYPLLLAAGAQHAVAWAAGRTARVAALCVAVAATAAGSALLALPLLPVRDAGPVVAVNGDVGETVGWPDLIDTIASSHPAGAVVLTQNYGEAGAVDRYGPALGLPHAYSGHNGYADWGPPPEQDRPVLTVGLAEARLRQWFTHCSAPTVFHNPQHLRNEEEGVELRLCDGRRETWAQLWPQVRHLD